MERQLYVVYESSKLGMIPTAYSSNIKTAESFISKHSTATVSAILPQDAEKIESLLKKLKIKNLD